jgi:lactoylglutathione lyase
MRFGYTILYVEDVEGAVSFYEAAFGLERRFVDESGQYAEMETGQTALAFASVELGEANLPAGFRKNDPTGLPAGIEITFVSQDVDAAFEAAIKAGATRVVEPTIKPWGQKVGYVRDLDGVLVEIGSEV